MIDSQERILRRKHGARAYSLSRSTLYRKIGKGSFPNQVAISERCVGWREPAVGEWMKNPMFYSVDD